MKKLLLSLFAISYCGAEYWEETWVESVGDATFEVNGVNVGILTIPEFNITEKGSLVANLMYTGDFPLTVAYKDGTCDGSCDGLVVESIANKELKVVDTHYLDYESSSQDKTPKTVTLQLMLGVTDWNKCGELANTCNCNPCKELRVDLENINDVEPDFAEFATDIDLFENQDNDAVTVITAEDTEFGPGYNEFLTLVLENADMLKPFSIVQDGVARWSLAVKNLDYDTGPNSYRLQLLLTDNPDRFGIAQTARRSMIINVKDQADNEPQWTTPCSYTSKNESLAIDTTYYEIQATDRDSDINSAMSYRIVDQTYDYFGIKASQENPGFWIVYNKVEINREEMDTTVITVKIEAEEEEDCVPVGDCIKTSTIECVIGVDDINDNAPEFSAQLYTAKVREDISPGIPFTFTDANGESPEITDLDVTYQYNQFSSKFADPSSVSDLTLSDQTFVGKGTVIIMTDISQNAFLDFETKTNFEFSVVATDIQDPILSSNAIFKVEILDVNDCVPQFQYDGQNGYSKEFKEDLSDLTDYVIITVQATDEDKSAEYGTLSIRYSLKTTPEGLDINAITGEITVDPDNNPFDAEENTEYIIEIEASDCKGNDCDQPANTNSATLVITITNVNDNPPTPDDPEACTDSFTNTVTRDNIMTLGAMDKDGDKFSFSIPKIPEEYAEFFPFSVTTGGDLTVDSNSIAEKQGDFTFTVAITDDGDPEALTTEITCTINITDVNDKRPHFTFPQAEEKYWINVASEVNEQLQLYNGTMVKLEATDDDVNECFRSISYDFRANIKENYTQYFDLSADGVITLTNNLSSIFLEDDNGIRNLITLPLQATDSYNRTNGDQCATDELTDVKDLKLKLFTDFPPKFVLRTKNVEFDEETKASVDLDKAIDDNNEDPPDDTHWENQEICYYLSNASEDIRQKFSIDKTTNTLSVIGDLDADCPDCDKYDLTVVASNDCVSEPEIVGEESIQNVVVGVNDLNDNIPQFDNIKTFYVLSTTEDDPDCKDCLIAASDADTKLDTSLKFEILNQNSSDPAVNISDPFELSYTAGQRFVTVVKSSSFNPLDYEDLQLYFDLTLQVTDSAAHSTEASVKIVMMTATNNVTFGFDNTLEDIEEQQNDIFKVLDETFQWSFSQKGIRESAFSRNVDMYSDSEPFTTIEGYFVDPITFQPKSQSEIAVEYDRLFDILYIALYTEANVTMDGRQGFRGATTNDFFNPDKFSAMIVGSVAGGLVAVTALFLLTAYCVRTNALERRVKALDTDAIEDGQSKKQDKIFLAGLQENVPGSNEFAESGANPIWQAAMESNDYDEDEFQFGDDVSESSGDSILIGVEDQTEFNDYAAKMKEVEVDMDLYSRVQGKYKTLDDYQVPDDDTEDTEVYNVGHAPGRNPMYKGDSDDDSA